MKNTKNLKENLQKKTKDFKFSQQETYFQDAVSVIKNENINFFIKKDVKISNRKSYNSFLNQYILGLGYPNPIYIKINNSFENLLKKFKFVSS